MCACLGFGDFCVCGGFLWVLRVLGGLRGLVDDCLVLVS